MKIKNRQVLFAVDADGALVRVVSGDANYTHRCPAKTYEEVAHLCEEEPRIHLDTFAEQHDLAFSQVHVALEFMRHRGVLGSSARKSWLVSPCTVEDAMTEYHWLREQGVYRGTDQPHQAH